jgi:hypothetical protein
LSASFITMQRRFAMIGKLFGAALGAEASKFSSTIGSPTGAVLGVLATPLVRRLSIPGMVVLGVGGYFAKKWFDNRAGHQQGATADRRQAATRRAASARHSTRRTAPTAASADA